MSKELIDDLSPDEQLAYDKWAFTPVQCANWNYKAATLSAWKAARDYYAPKLTEVAAAEILIREITDRLESSQMIVPLPANKQRAQWIGAKTIQALAAAGVRFREENNG